MNKSYLIHGIWVIVAVAAYAFGSRSSSSVGKQTPDSSSPNSTVNTRVSDRGEQASSERKARISARQREATGEPRIYTPADLATLGEEFRKAKGPLERRLAFAKILEALTPCAVLP